MALTFYWIYQVIPWEPLREFDPKDWEDPIRDIFKLSVIFRQTLDDFVSGHGVRLIVHVNPHNPSGLENSLLQQPRGRGLFEQAGLPKPSWIIS